jgi:hypothetical protein
MVFGSVRFRAATCMCDCVFLWCAVDESLNSHSWLHSTVAKSPRPITTEPCFFPRSPNSGDGSRCPAQKVPGSRSRVGRCSKYAHQLDTAYVCMGAGSPCVDASLTRIPLQLDDNDSPRVRARYENCRGRYCFLSSSSANIGPERRPGAGGSPLRLRLSVQRRSLPSDSDVKLKLKPGTARWSSLD